MKPTDVTDEMADKLRREQCVDWGRKEIIAASVNAVLGDPTPITVERLVARGWERIVEVCHRRVSDHLYLFWDGFDLTIIDDGGSVDMSSIKTIGQLRALEIGLGIEPCP